MSLTLALRRLRVRIALARADGSPERERAIIDAYDHLVEREPRIYSGSRRPQKGTGPPEVPTGQ